MRADPWAQSLGLEYLNVERGKARVRLTLQPHMLNFQGSPHGGVIFSLADAAFSAASNSHGEPAVALSMSVSFVAAAPPDATLVAEAVERRQGRRAGFYDITVTSTNGTLVATLQCVAYRPRSGASTP